MARESHATELPSLKSATRRSRGLCAFLLLLLGFFLLQGAAGAQVKEVRRVLVLSEVGPDYPAIALVDQGIHHALEQSRYKVEFYHEYLDAALFPDSATQQEFRDWYVRKYRNRKPDVIITVGPSPLELTLGLHETFFRDVPVIFCASTEDAVGGAKLDADFTGIWEEAEPVKTLEAALRLQPGTKHVFVVGGTSPYDRANEALFRERLRSYESKLDFQYFTDFTMPQLLERLQHLPNHSIVLHVCILRDAAGTQFIDATEAAPMVVRASNAPVFTFFDVDLGYGEVGGDVSSFASEGQVAGAMALRIIGGEKPKDIPVVRGTNVYMFDWRALERWRLNEQNLPPGSIVLNRPVSFWQVYRRYILAGILVISAQSLAIFALLWQRARRRKTEQELRESEERFRLIANSAPVMIWMSGPDKLCTYFNPPRLEFTGRTLREELGNGWAEGVHPEDLEPCLETYSQAFDRRESFQMEYRLRRHDGEYRWIFDHGVPRFNADGAFAGFVGFCIDVTGRKEAEEALSSVSRKLIEAHEEERTWIARELHDDIDQRIALLAVNLDGLGRDLPASEGQTSRRIKEVQEYVSDLGSDIQALSHRLHSSKLEYLGLVAACEAFCREFSGQQNVEIDFHSQDIPKELPPETALCLFRVLQEALQNAVKHSGARQFEVLLKAASNEIQLSVHDSGVGFDLQKAMSGHGLGFTSMKERMRLIGGHLSIDLKQQGGTTIHARVPLRTESMAAGAGGQISPSEL